MAQLRWHGAGKAEGNVSSTSKKNVDGLLTIIMSAKAFIIT